MNGWKGKFAGLAMALMGMGAAADAATYNFVSSVAGGGVTGTILTDGTIGTLGTSNILDWNLVLNDGINVFNLIGDGSVGDNSQVWVVGSSFSASATDLTFDFLVSGYVLFQFPTLGSGLAFMCFTSPSPEYCGRGGVSFSATTSFENDTVSTPQSGQLVIATAVAAVPLPAALPMMALALGGLGALARRKRRAST